MAIRWKEVPMSDLNDKADKNHIEGVAGEAKGRIRSAVGELTGDGDQQLKGKGEQLKGKAKQVLGDVQDALGDEADRDHHTP
jgi:uncharacterized protein YjbJ (UPF0337 family)